MKTWLKITLAILAAGLVVAGIGLLYLFSGAYNIAATDDHTGAVRWILSTTQTRSVKAHAKEELVDVPTDSAAVQRGFQAFTEMCVICHGAPGVDRGWMGQGMNPTPPDLSRMAERYNSEELYWIVSHGLKMAGMPALSPTHSREEILEIVAFVERLPELSEEEYQAWNARLQPAPDAPSATHDDGHDHTH